MRARRYQEVGLEPEVVYEKPSARTRFPEEERLHVLDLEVRGRSVGHAELMYASHPIPSYYLNFIFVRELFRGFGFGSAILDQVNLFLLEKGKMGILYNSISKDSSAREMYARAGWHESKKFSGWMTFNEPKDATPAALDQSIVRAGKWLSKTEKKEEKELRKAA